MNKHIAALAEQAAQEIVNEVNDTNLLVEYKDVSYQIPAEFIEKFAELVIKDCARQVRHVHKQGGGTYGETILAAFDLPPRYD